MENDELVRFFIERGVISTEERVKELEKRGWVKVTPDGFNDVCKEFAEKMKEKYPEEFECGKRIAEYIEVETRSKITRMEMTYLAIHIKRVTMAEE